MSSHDIAANFEEAATQVGETITVTPYAPTPLAPRDPFALVPAALLIPLLVGGYMAADLLVAATGMASDRWRIVWLAGYAVSLALVIDVLVTFWLEGLPSASFWVVWPILALIILVVALVTSVLRRVLGPLGVLVTVILLIQFGNPSSGGANGVPYLPGFWSDLGPFLPPRNAFLLLRDTVYFDAQGILQPLAVLLAYAVVAGGILTFLDWYRSPKPVADAQPDLDASAAAGAVPVGLLP